MFFFMSLLLLVVKCFVAAKVGVFPSKHQENEFTKSSHFMRGVEKQFTKSLQEFCKRLSFNTLQRKSRSRFHLSTKANSSLSQCYKIERTCPSKLFQGKQFFSFFSSNLPSFCPILPFFSFFLKKMLNCFAGSEKGRTFALAFRKRGARNSIFDRLRTEIQDKQRVHIIYIIYGCACTSRSHSFLHRLINEQWSRKAWPVRQNYKNNNYYSEEFDPGSG